MVHHRRWPLRSLILLLPLAVAAGGCASAGPARVETTPGGGVAVVGGMQLGWARKVVATKQPPETLVARDGTVCRVAPDRYNDTAPGALIDCDWQPGAAPADSL